MSILIFLHSTVLCLSYFTKLQLTYSFIFSSPSQKHLPTVPCYRFPLQTLGLSQHGKGSFRKKNRIVLHAVKSPASPFPYSSRGGIAQQVRKDKPGFMFWTFLIVSVGTTERCFSNPHPFKLSKQPHCDATCLLQRVRAGNCPSFRRWNFKRWIFESFMEN